jgi:hypothetical protein
MAYKLIDAAQARWRAVNAPHLVALVRAGAVFHKGKLLERPIDITPTDPSTAEPQTAGSESPETHRSQVLTIAQRAGSRRSVQAMLIRSSYRSTKC